MKTMLLRTPLAAGVLLAGLAFLPYSVYGQEMPGPGPEHEALKAMEGTWDATIRSAQGDSKGVMTCKMVCGGLWLATEFTGDFGGMAFSGRGFDGYDPVKMKYVSVWVDSMSYRPMQSEGTRDAATKTMTMIGMGTGFDGSPAKFKSVTRMVDDDHMEFKLSVVGADGSDTEMMTTEYVRRK